MPTTNKTFSLTISDLDYLSMLSNREKTTFSAALRKCLRSARILDVVKSDLREMILSQSKTLTKRIDLQGELDKITNLQSEES